QAASVKAGAVVGGLGRPEGVHTESVRAHRRAFHGGVGAIDAGARRAPANLEGAVALGVRVEPAPTDSHDDRPATPRGDAPVGRRGLVRHPRSSRRAGTVVAWGASSSR